MRRFLKKQILQKLTDGAQMHVQIRQGIETRDFEGVQNLFVLCQEMALWVGNAVEVSEGTSNEAVNQGVIHRLEAYCEDIYQLSLRVSVTSEELEEDTNQALSIIRTMDVCLQEAAEYIRNEIEEKLEVVFFPYKASMWDSLESVWKAADEDVRCECYVVPIPYFDKNPDGTVSAMHYEGADFPEYVPITDWQEYSVAERHPDIVYIHNPYDNANRVTTVYVDFYAKELKKHTEMLVYIPYFVVTDAYVAKEFSILPGTMYADRVIVQSEEVRQVYIKEFHKFEEEYNCRGRFGVAEEKFMALGSPKYDKVFAARREDMQLPEDWVSKIMRTDGSRRNVLLYNTSVTTLLEKKEKILEKIEAVFTLLKNREDIVLLWRPHPLSATTYAAMRPDLGMRYQEIVKKYKEENWGIYDDTPDLHRAIAVSDAYYGDASSLVELYRVTGKPIMIQDAERKI